MKKTQAQQETYCIDQFLDHINLWSIPKCKGIELLQSIVDSMHYDSYTNAVGKTPSVLITGKHSHFIARAFVNSLVSEDIRVCESHYLDSGGINSSYLFQDTTHESVNLITDIENLHKNTASVIWRYLTQGRCAYYNFATKEFDKIVHSNGMIVLTTQKYHSASKSIVKAVDYLAHIHPYGQKELSSLTEQYLNFCSIKYRKNVIAEIVGSGQIDIDTIVRTIRTCITLLKSEMREYLTVNVVRKAQKMNAQPVQPPVKDDIPF